MRAAQALQAGILHNITEGLVIAAPSGAILAFNPAAVRLHGFANEAEACRRIADDPTLFEVSDLRGQPRPPEDWPVRRALRGEVFTHHVLRVRRRDTGQEFIGSYGGV